MNPDIIGPAGLAVAAGVCAFRLWKRRTVRKNRTVAPRGAPERELIPGLLSLHDACSGVLVMGGTGSGKTTGPGEQMASGLLKHGAGVLVLTAKVDEAARWQRYAEQAGRAADFLRVYPGGPHRLDFLNDELSSPGGDCVTAGQLMEDVVDSVSKSMSENDEPFWPVTAARVLRSAITVVHRAHGSCSVRDVYRFVTSLPNAEQVKSEDWRKTAYCAQSLLAAGEKFPDDADLDLAAQEVLHTWPAMSDKTSGCVMAYMMATLDPFLTGEVGRLVSGPSTLGPADVLRGKVVVVDAPVLRYRESGRLLQLVWKLAVQRAALRRDLTGNPRPVCIWQDEGQFFLTKTDCMAQTVARQSRLINVLLAQNLPMLYHARGGGPTAKQEVDGLLANHMTKILCANACHETNQFFSELLGHSRHLFAGGNTQFGDYSPWDDFMGNDNGTRGSASFNEQWHPDVPPEAFTKLAKGGNASGFVVEGFVFQGGRSYPQNGGKTWVKAEFRQRISS